MTCLAGRASGGLPLAVDLHQTGDERAVPATLRRGIEDEFEERFSATDGAAKAAAELRLLGRPDRAFKQGDFPGQRS